MSREKLKLLLELDNEKWNFQFVRETNSNLSKRWTFVITNSKPYKNSPCILSLNMHGLFVTLDFVCDERVFIFWIDINAL